MFDQLKKDRQVGFGAQERLRLSLYVAGLLALGGIIVVFATRGGDAPKEEVAAAPVVVDPEVPAPDAGPLLDPDEVRRLVLDSKAAPERLATNAIEYIRKIQRKGSLGPVALRTTPSALEPAPGAVVEVQGRVIEKTSEEYRASAEATEDAQLLWSIIVEDPNGAHVVALKHARSSDLGGGAPSDAKPPFVRTEAIDVGQNVIVRGVYLQERTGTIGRTVLRKPTPVLFASKFRIELAPEEQLPPIASLDQALWSDVQDRFNRESRRWDEDAVFEVIQWARQRGYAAVADDVFGGDLGWKDWGKQVFKTWKEEVAVDSDDPRPFMDAARGKVHRVSGIVGEVIQYGWGRVPRNPWGVDQFQLLTLISDHYRSVALRMILPYPITTFEGVEGLRKEHLRVYGVFVKNNTYDTQFDRPDGSGRPQPITVPMFVVLHAERFPEGEAGRGMRTLMMWVAGVMVALALLFYIVLIRGGQKQAERMEAHRWKLRRQARASGGGAVIENPPPLDDPRGTPAGDD